MTFHTRRAWTLVGAMLLSLAAGFLAGPAHAASEPAAPEIALSGLQWFNVPGPIPIASLKGRIVILDFWTEGCINCIHIISTLRAIEQKYPQQVVVVGVHSPKFAKEKSATSVQDAIRRYEIHHPIVHDPEMKIWNAYGVQAWPTLVIIGTDGQVLGLVPGEPDPAVFEKAIGKLVADSGRAGTLKLAKLDLKLLPEPQGRFLYPGKIKPVPGGTERRWALADGGHDQIVLLDDHGQDVRRYGSGTTGAEDGAAEQASFNHPQGLIASEDAIFVADTGNHKIRRIDLKTGTVTTLAGTGERGQLLASPSHAATTALASPWDLELKSRKLFFANAGTHQIGVLDLDAASVGRFAGNGDEALVAGSAASSSFAQPSGLALSADGKTLYVADAESSAIRAVDVKNGDVTTLVGAGLFEFGRVDGDFDKARLQHPLGVTVDGSQLLVADTYNSTIRSLTLQAKTVSEFDGGAFTCQDKVCIPTREPAGIFAADPDRVLLVDTGNQRIEEYRPSDKTYHTWAR